MVAASSARTSFARSDAPSISRSAETAEDPASHSPFKLPGLNSPAERRLVRGDAEKLPVTCRGARANASRRAAAFATSTRRTLPRRSAKMRSCVQELGGAETGQRAAYVDSVGHRVAAFSGIAAAGPGAAFHDAQFGGRECFLGSRRLCLCHPAADGPHGATNPSSPSHWVTKLDISQPIMRISARRWNAS